MLPLPTVQISGKSVQLHELTFNAGIKVSRIPFSQNEHRITVFLQHVLNDQDLPLQITAQERYFLLLNYLDNQQGTLTQTPIDCKPYMQHIQPTSLLSDDASQPAFATTAEYEQTKIRLMTGRDAELLEKSCVDLADWLIGSMALELDHPDMPAIHAPDCDSDVLRDSLINRAGYLKNLPQAQFDAFYAAHNHLHNQTAILCRLSLDDDGIILLGGTDDAPMRFRPSTSFIGVVAELDRRATRAGVSDQRGHADDV
jgi:hypothetical protein